MEEGLLVEHQLYRDWPNHQEVLRRLYREEETELEVTVIKDRLE